MRRLCFKKMVLTLSLASLPNLIQASPASKEYVDKQIHDALEAVQVQLHQQNTKIETELNELTHHIGESYQGGLVIWVDESGQHGLIAAKGSATYSAVQWRNGESGEKTTNAKANGVFAGLSNTQLIISEQTIDDQEGQFAALVAHQFAVQDDGMAPCDKTHICYGNWYLPSLTELQLIQQNAYFQGISGRFWSSSEESISSAYLLDFSSGKALSMDKATEALVLPIHSF
ncbi:hypothetical protein [Legionella anisa]|uniref:hypothetical protein n=1 Tax=Legionella anisa TaxID=28082 RepID=UPI0005915ACD|nr:hypothetical protein [Legionella anisa]